MRAAPKGQGDVILNKFVIEDRWDRTAIVYKVYDRDDPARKYIVKRVRPEHAELLAVLDWFSREVRIWQQVTGHPNIVRLVHPWRIDTDGVNYFFIEYIEGGHVAEIIGKTTSGRLACPQVLIWAWEIADAMEFVSQRSRNGHGTLVHRDLDSTNVLINRDGRVKINDWGLAKDLTEPEAQIPTTTIQGFKDGWVGKCTCMPPEQFPPRRGKDYGVAGDIYYFGSLLYEMLTAEPANPKSEAARLVHARTEQEVQSLLETWQGQHLRPMLNSVCQQKELAGLIADCLHVEEDRRPQSFSTIKNRLMSIEKEVRKTGIPGTYSQCRGCSFIGLEPQATCPVCGRSAGFVRWEPGEFKLTLSMLEPQTPEEPEEKTPPPIPAEPKAKEAARLSNSLVTIRGGTAVVGARAEFVTPLQEKYHLKGAQLAQFLSPPEQRIQLEPFAIARYAVSNFDYQEFTEKTGWRIPPHWPKSSPSALPSSLGDQPVTHVDFHDAEAFCQWKGCRLPTNAEWERAARGPEGRPYPWGNRWPEEGALAHTLERHKQTKEELVSVDALADGASAEGLLNMAGNVWEWVDGGEGKYKHSRGGSWRYLGQLYSLNWFRIPTEGTLLQDDVGFRYARDAEAGKGSRLSPEEVRQTVEIPAGRYPLGVSTDQLLAVRKVHELTENDMRVLGQNSYRVCDMRGFKIRRYLVTNEEYYQFVRENGYPAWPKHWNRELLKWSERPYLDKYRDHPVTGVSYRDAVAFCSWCGGRLPTNEQWETAARGPEGTLYPWGNCFEPTKCNTAEAGLARTCPVNFCPGGASRFGCCDMAGNVLEWTLRDEPSGQYFVRGGSYEDRGTLQGLTYLQVRADPEIELATIGFRAVFQ